MAKREMKDGAVAFGGVVAWNKGKKAGPSKSSTIRRQLFVQEYLVDLNATRAYKAAGYTCEGASAQKRAVALMKEPEVAAMVDKGLQERLKRAQINQDRVLEEYAKLAFLDPRKFFDKEGKLLPIHEMPQDIAAAIGSIDVVELFDKDSKANITTSKVKFADKKGALDSIARHLGMFTEKVEVTGANGGPQEHVQNFGGTAEDAYRRMVETPKKK